MLPSHSPNGPSYAKRTASQRLLSTLLCLSALLAAGCGQQGGGYAEYGAENYRLHGDNGVWAPHRYYRAPGLPGDPWGPYIQEASAQYGVPEQWIRAVMQQESGGQEQAVSPVGAMGLMQVMPATYDGLRARYGLGDDPYDPHNNILAGTAYIHEMYDRFGAPTFLAAYNAGPDRVDSYLAGTTELPDETVNYLAAVTPNLGDAVPLSGPLARYASVRAGGVRATAPDVASLAAGCDLSAAYDPNHPCTSLMRAATAPAPVQLASVAQTGMGGCDLSAAYDPSHPCSSVQQVAPVSAPPSQPAVVEPAAAGGCDLSAAYDPSHPCTSAGREIVASAAPQPAPVQPGAANGCDLNAAYNPNHPCRPNEPASPRAQLASAEGCDLNAALDPDSPCHAPPSAVSLASSSRMIAQPVSATTSFSLDQAALSPRREPIPAAPSPSAGPHLLAIPDRDWAIQVGAFASPALARAVAEGARSEAPDQLRSATLALPPTPYGGSVFYRARLAHLSASAAADACWRLNQRQLPCVVVQPNRS
jgi:D-alanyl-D-alanine carboxypeptidase